VLRAFGPATASRVTGELSENQSLAGSAAALAMITA
jgi:hypothetical protein